MTQRSPQVIAAGVAVVLVCGALVWRLSLSSSSSLLSSSVATERALRERLAAADAAVVALERHRDELAGILNEHIAAGADTGAPEAAEGRLPHDEAPEASVASAATADGRFVLVDPAESTVEAGDKTVLILSPMKDRGAGGISSYLRQLATMDYPKKLISIGILEGDSTDDTFASLKEHLPKLQEYRSVMLIKKNFNFKITGWGDRHALGIQKDRRAVMAKARNHLLMSALRDEEWVLWLDSDLASYPETLLRQLMASGKQIVVPNCVMSKGGRSYDLNSFQETEQSVKLLAAMDADQLVFEGYAATDVHRKHLSDLRAEPVVPLDGVGGTALLVHADIHRSGLVFPTFAFDHQIETEGLAKMALRMGYQPYGMPNLEVLHY